MRVLTKPTTAACTLEHYTAFLLAESQSAGCVRLAEVSGGEFCHDAANRFLNREEFTAKDLFEEVHPQIVLAGGTLSVDGTVLDKPYSQEGKTDLVGYFWSGKHGRAVKGVFLVSLFYTDAKGMRLPVNFRAVDKAEAKTKNELFREMVTEVLAWGLKPAVVSADSWYSGVENLKFLRDQGLGFHIGLEKNRIVSEREHDYRRVEDLELPAAGRVLHLRGFGFVSVFRTVDKNNDARHYAAFEPRKKAHEDCHGSFRGPTPSALGHRVLPPRPQTGLSRRALLRALEGGHPQPSLLCVTRLRPPRSRPLARESLQLVCPQTPPLGHHLVHPARLTPRNCAMAARGSSAASTSARTRSRKSRL